MDILRIFHVYWRGRHIHGIYVVYTRHIPKIRVPDELEADSSEHLESPEVETLAYVCYIPGI
jgi:hypothetical protein